MDDRDIFTVLLDVRFLMRYADILEREFSEPKSYAAYSRMCLHSLDLPERQTCAIRQTAIHLQVPRTSILEHYTEKRPNQNKKPCRNIAKPPESKIYGRV